MTILNESTVEQAALSWLRDAIDRLNHGLPLSQPGNVYI